MKYIISTIVSCFIAIFILSVKVSALDYQVLNVYNDDSQETATFISAYTSIGYPQNSVPSNEVWTNYHIDITCSPITGATSTNPYLIRLYFNSDGDYEFELSRDSNGLLNISCVSQFRALVMQYYRSSWQVARQTYFQYLTSFQIQSNEMNPATQYLQDIDLYVVNNTLNSYSFTGQVNEPNSYVDNFFAYKDGNGIAFGVEPTFNSQFYGTYFVTQEYTLTLEMYRNGSFTDVSFDSFEYYLVQLNQNMFTNADGAIDRILFQDYPNLRYWSKMRGVMVSKYEYTAESPPDSTYNQNNWVKWKSNNIVTLNQILARLQTIDQNATANDVLTQYRLRFYYGNRVASEQIIDFTPIAGTPTITELPPDDEGTPDPYDPWSDLNNNLSTNNHYLQSIAYGDTYMSNGMSQLLLNINEDELNPFDMPEYELTDPDFDDTTMSWFRRVVTWWYSTPFGFIAVVALTFLIIRTIVW